MVKKINLVYSQFTNCRYLPLEDSGQAIVGAVDIDVIGDPDAVDPLEFMNDLIFLDDLALILFNLTDLDCPPISESVNSDDDNDGTDDGRMDRNFLNKWILTKFKLFQTTI